jgi:hypothetical protein
MQGGNRLSRSAFIDTAQPFNPHSRHLSRLCDLSCGDAKNKPHGAGVTSDDPREIQMNVTKVLGLAAVGAMLMLAAPTERAQALSLSNPGAAAAVQDGSKQITTEVRWHHHRHWGYHRYHHRHWRRW